MRWQDDTIIFSSVNQESCEKDADVMTIGIKSVVRFLVTIDTAGVDTIDEREILCQLYSSNLPAAHSNRYEHWDGASFISI